MPKGSKILFMPSTIKSNSPPVSKDHIRRTSVVACSATLDAAETETSIGLNLSSIKPPRNWLNIATNLTIFGGAFSALFYKGYVFESSSWRGWTYFEKANHILTGLWRLYETNSVAHPILVPAVITGVTYGLADWISQTYEGRFALDFDNVRLLRNAAIGFLLLGPFAHLYYENQELLFKLIIPADGEKPWWSVPAHIALDQSLYTAVYNVIYYSSVGLVRGDKPSLVLSSVKRNFWRLMKAGWRLWPFVHIITYSLIPAEHRVLWVDSVEIVWATILTIVVNESHEDNLETLKALDDSPAKELVLESIEHYIAEVREKEWEQEFLPEQLKENLVFKSENMQETMLAEMDIEEKTLSGLNKLIDAEILFLENDGSCIPGDVANSSYVINDDSIVCEEAEIAFSTLPLVEQVQVANLLDGVIAEKGKQEQAEAEEEAVKAKSI
eukprot:CAMPEP_0196573930 /NCGR_PEP_ID=MMETSP1081-20130531/3738_1 /TAXON_ID=36882 /ORGANISM="Pyramimonas amylifera, Strain CCMP720" /LENGTH=441 /DNA_ID=CAMNT_0041891787 /DNA_START=291 /DNA_END=1616 /DNA_ORIENTATION=+